MTSGRPLLSIVIPSFNQASFIREAIDSALLQEYRPIEVIVVDGASTDGTVDILETYRSRPEVRWTSEPDRGVVDAVNKGMARARGDYLAIQSSDDLYLPGAFSRVMTEFERDASLALVYGDVEYIDENGTIIGRTELPRFDLVDYVGKLTFIPQPAAFFSSSAARAAGPWREEVSYAADAEFYLRIAERFPVRKINAVLARYRYHPAQRDKAGERIKRDWEAVVRPLLASPDPRIRRSARSGVELVKFHYTPEERWIRRTFHLYRAIAANPALISRWEIRRERDLLPGQYPVRRLLSRIKRALGFRPRGT
ncbi:MAG TPA: glycosyltransferase family 2 protein [Thermoanaerobaculia bacterium]|nr:glycosyltransferase family 2 protein [Thermoanaerobaculia bacterium]